MTLLDVGARSVLSMRHQFSGAAKWSTDSLQLRRFGHKKLQFSGDLERSLKHAFENLVVATHPHGLILHMPTRTCKYTKQCTTCTQVPPMQISL